MNNVASSALRLILPRILVSNTTARCTLPSQSPSSGPPNGHSALENQGSLPVSKATLCQVVSDVCHCLPFGAAEVGPRKISLSDVTLLDRCRREAATSSTQRANPTSLAAVPSLVQLCHASLQIAFPVLASTPPSTLLSRPSDVLVALPDVSPDGTDGFGDVRRYVVTLSLLHNVIVPVLVLASLRKGTPSAVSPAGIAVPTLTDTILGGRAAAFRFAKAINSTEHVAAHVLSRVNDLLVESVHVGVTCGVLRRNGNLVSWPGEQASWHELTASMASFQGQRSAMSRRELVALLKEVSSAPERLQLATAALAKLAAVNLAKNDELAEVLERSLTAMITGHQHVFRSMASLDAEVCSVEVVAVLQGAAVSDSDAQPVYKATVEEVRRRLLDALRTSPSKSLELSDAAGRVQWSRLDHQEFGTKLFKKFVESFFSPTEVSVAEGPRSTVLALRADASSALSTEAPRRLLNAGDVSLLADAVRRLRSKDRSSESLREMEATVGKARLARLFACLPSEMTLASSLDDVELGPRQRSQQIAIETVLTASGRLTSVEVHQQQLEHYECFIVPLLQALQQCLQPDVRLSLSTLEHLLGWSKALKKKWGLLVEFLKECPNPATSPMNAETSSEALAFEIDSDALRFVQKHPTEVSPKAHPTHPRSPAPQKKQFYEYGCEGAVEVLRDSLRIVFYELLPVIGDRKSKVVSLDALWSAVDWLKHETRMGDLVGFLRAFDNIFFVVYDRQLSESVVKLDPAEHTAVSELPVAVGVLSPRNITFVHVFAALIAPLFPPGCGGSILLSVLHEALQWSAHFEFQFGVLRNCLLTLGGLVSVVTISAAETVSGGNTLMVVVHGQAFPPPLSHTAVVPRCWLDALTLCYLPCALSNTAPTVGNNVDVVAVEQVLAWNAESCLLHPVFRHFVGPDGHLMSLNQIFEELAAREASGMTEARSAASCYELLRAREQRVLEQLVETIG